MARVKNNNPQFIALEDILDEYLSEINGYNGLKELTSQLKEKIL